MKTKLNKIPVIALALFLCTASSCIKEQPCPVYEDRHYHISEEEMAYVPYTGHDTLTFLRFEGNHVDTITFAGQGIQEYIEHDSYGYGEHHCDGRILKHSVAIDFVEINSLRNSKINYKIIPTRMSSSFLMEIENYPLSGSYGRLRNTEASFYFATFLVDSLTFYDVVVSGQKPHIHTHKVYYNAENGIVRMELRDSSIVYQLIP